MFYVYVLKSLSTDNFYIGCTEDLRRRFVQHNSGESSHTWKYMPWELIYYEAYSSRKLACDRERKLKHHGKGFAELKKRILEG